MTEAVREVSERRASPFRFTNSAMRRRRGASPVRIPTIFAKADNEAAKYREIIQEVSIPRGNSPNPAASIRRPVIPISTPIARGAESHLEGYVGTPERNPKGGRPPLRAVRSGGLSLPGGTAVDADGSPKLPLRDTSNIDTDITVATPKIKPNLLTDFSGRRLGKIASSKVNSPTRRGHRGSPIKPVKRLQSPRSPYHSRSPKRYITSPGKGHAPMSPLLVDKNLF